MKLFTKFRAALRLREAIIKADKAFSTTGNRYYVMPGHGSRGQKLIVMDRRNFRRLKIKHYINRDVRVGDLVRECFYCTPQRNGRQFLSPHILKLKRQQYFDWVEADR